MPVQGVLCCHDCGRRPLTPAHVVTYTTYLKCINDDFTVEDLEEQDRDVDGLSCSRGLRDVMQRA